MLSDLDTPRTIELLLDGLNAPFGAQCFPTEIDCPLETTFVLVSMHLLVLSAFRPYYASRLQEFDRVSMHLLVLSAFRH